MCQEGILGVSSGRDYFLKLAYFNISGGRRDGLPVPKLVELSNMFV